KLSTPFSQTQSQNEPTLSSVSLGSTSNEINQTNSNPVFQRLINLQSQFPIQSQNICSNNNNRQLNLQTPIPFPLGMPLQMTTVQASIPVMSPNGSYFMVTPLSTDSFQ